ncbi:N-acetyltransferase [uncultured Psychrosphaera sp.]|uniref:GNAT family N-acetyltransferase n=1 Tax=uncultured Psychrosphaera sp. TaxID=1403522 RepID=UPI0030F7B83A
MIKQLDNVNENIAEQIYAVFQHAYRIEADLIGVVNFPPLSRSIKDIQGAKTQFYGFYVDQIVAAVIEINLEGQQLNICSLTVAPNYFRRGIADTLISYVLGLSYFSKALVETAVVNLPAIKLYEKHGFIEYKRWVPSHGIAKVAMSRIC